MQGTPIRGQVRSGSPNSTGADPGGRGACFVERRQDQPMGLFVVDDRVAAHLVGHQALGAQRMSAEMWSVVGRTKEELW